MSNPNRRKVWKSLQDDLEEMERNDPIVAIAARRYNETVLKVVGEETRLGMLRVEYSRNTRTDDLDLEVLDERVELARRRLSAFETGPRPVQWTRELSNDINRVHDLLIAELNKFINQQNVQWEKEEEQ